MRHWYIGNYPFKCLRKRVTSEIWCVCFCSPFVCLSAAGVLCYGRWALDKPTLINVVGGVFFLAAFVWFTWFWLLKGIKHNFICRIVPYFESRVGFGKIHAFKGGIELAKQWRMLDNLACEIGVKPLSDFGFKDDRDGRKLIWHNSSEGINTIICLKERLQNNQKIIPLVQELDVLQNNLEQAKDKNVRFCLLIRSGLDKMISPMEMDDRKGFFW
jgi:hypothetical protein